MTSQESAESSGDRPAWLEKLLEWGQDLLAKGVDKLAKFAADKVEDFASNLEGMASGGGIGMSALLNAGMAKLKGENPVWAAIKGATSSMGTGTKVVIALLLVLTAVLAPVVFLVLAIGLLVAAIVGAVKN